MAKISSSSKRAFLMGNPLRRNVRSNKFKIENSLMCTQCTKPKSKKHSGIGCFLKNQLFLQQNFIYHEYFSLRLWRKRTHLYMENCPKQALQESICGSRQLRYSSNCY